MRQVPWAIILLLAPGVARAEVFDAARQHALSDPAVRRAAAELVALSRAMAIEWNGARPAHDWTQAFRPAAGLAQRRVSDQVVELSAPDQGFAARIQFAAGEDLFKPGRHLLTTALTPENSWRREVDMSFEATDLDGALLTFTAGAFSGRQPVIAGFGIRHGVGEFSRWMASDTWDTGLKIQSLDGRFRYSGGVSWSRYSLERASQLDRRDGFLLNRPQWRDGFSWWQKAEADFWKAQEGGASAYVVVGSMDEAYRTLQGRSDTPLIFNGKTFGAGGEVRQGKAKATFAHTETDGVEFSNRETNGTVAIGRVSLSLSGGGWGYRAVEGEAWSLDQSYSKAKLKVSLAGVKGARPASGFLPDSAYFVSGRSRMRADFPGLQTLSAKSTVGFGLTWSGKRTSTDIGISRITTLKSNSPSILRAEGREFSLDFNHAYVGDGWDVLAYGSVITKKGAASSDRFLAGGAELSIHARRAPRMSLGVDVNSYDLTMPASAYRFRDQGVSVSATMDLSKYARRALVDPKSYLLVKAYGDWSRSGDVWSPYETSLTPTVMVVLGTRF